MEHPIAAIRDIKRFLFAGKSIITLKYSDSEVRFTYRITEPHDANDTRFFVKLLTGNDNENSYTYLGTIFDTRNFRLTKGSTIGNTAESFKMFDVFFNELMENNHVCTNMLIYHSGKCDRCGRTLTVPESIENGLGPECNGLVANSIREVREKKIEKYSKLKNKTHERI